MSNQRIQPELLGGRLIKAFYQIVNTARIHQDNNQLVKESVAQFHDILSSLSEGNSDVPVQVWRGRFHVQGEKILYQREIFSIINEMVEYFSNRNLDGVNFLVSVKGVSPEDIVTFVRLLNDSIRHDNAYEWLNAQLKANEFSWVELYLKQEDTEQSPDMRRKEKARHAYFHALNTVKEVAEKASKGIAGVRKARRLAQTIVDLVEEDNSLLLGLSTIRDYDDYTYTHSVNVALLATCLGRYVGLSQVFLEHLTVCGLFHDLGKVGVSKEILLKRGQLSADEWDKMRRHPLIGVRKILRLNAPHSLRSRIILGPFEHHLNVDMTGYPKTHFMKKLSLLGKILRIADVYEALTSERVYRPRAFTPDEALRRMWSERGKSFDTLLLKSFINMMGIYPIGSIVELNTGEIGLVMEYPDESEKSLPVIVLLKDDGKGGLEKGEAFNLATQDNDDTFSRKSIVGGIHFSRLGIQPSLLFVQ